MTDQLPHSATGARWSKTSQWLLLAIVAVLVSAVLELAGIPAAILLGGMIGGVLLGVKGVAIAVPQLGFASAQAIVGCLIASSLSTGIFSAFAADWPLFAGAVFATIAASSFLGWLISRWNVLPGTVGVWGSAPGAATAMVLMAGAFGADERLVAFMQYLRVVMVTIGAAMIAGIWIDTSGTEAPATVWFAPIEPYALGATFAVAAAGAVLGRLVRLPSPFFLGPFLLGSALHLGVGVEFQLPAWLLASSYMLIGWAIGLKFRRETLADAARALPQIVLSILALMAFCGGIAWLLAHQMGIDPLTAYLATSPGGMDSVAIIAAASTDVDISFVMTMQALRFLFVLMFGPALARIVAGWVKR